MKILIAEDETIIRLDLRGMLEHAGFEVCAEAVNGEEAVQLAREAKPDLAILDVKMPELDGIEAARRILAERPIPIVMLTAFGDRETVAEAIRAGVFAYLVKPFREQDLVPAVETAMARHREWLASRRELGRELGRPGPVDVSVGTGAKWPLRFKRNDSGALEVEIMPDRPA
jgi:response regulator NasT